MSERIETLAVHAGVHPDPTTGAIMTPIFQTSTYVQKSPGVHRGYEYSRTANPTRSCLEASIAELEGGKFGLALSSGCTGVDILLHSLNQKDHVLSCDDVYGGTHRLLKKIWSNHGIDVTFSDFTKESIETQFRKNTKIVWIESPTNPLLKVIDIEKIVSSVRKLSKDCLVVVDNTFATPYFQKPLSLGADVVLHSTTKYLNGHSDVVGGALVINHKDLRDKLHFIQNSMGGVSGPFDSWLVLRGIKTLAVRMAQHEKNAFKVAEFLSSHPKVEKVIYPGLPSHPQHAIAKKQMSGFGGMVTFFIKGGLEQSRKFLENVSLFSLAESLGGVESLVDHPAIMTHASVPKEIRESLGISDNLIRLSVGIEYVEDLTNDLNHALSEV